MAGSFDDVNESRLRLKEVKTRAMMEAPTGRTYFVT